MGIPALVLGLLAAATAWTGWAGVVLGLFGVAAGYLGARRAWKGLATDGGPSLGGLALSAVGLVWGGVVVSQTLFGSGTFGDGLTLDQCLAQADLVLRDAHVQVPAHHRVQPAVSRRRPVGPWHHRPMTTSRPDDLPPAGTARRGLGGLGARRPSCSGVIAVGDGLGPAAGSAWWRGSPRSSWGSSGRARRSATPTAPAARRSPGSPWASSGWSGGSTWSLPPLFGAGAFGEGLTLDECMGQANGQQEQRMCATQHLDEYRARDPQNMSAAPPVGVLALQGNVPEHLDALRACGADPRPVRRPEELEQVEGLVLPGGESTTLSKLLVTRSTCSTRCGRGWPPGCRRSARAPG